MRRVFRLVRHGFELAGALSLLGSLGAGVLLAAVVGFFAEFPLDLRILAMVGALMIVTATCLAAIGAYRGVPSVSVETGSHINRNRLMLNEGNPRPYDEWLVTVPDFRVTNHTDKRMSIDVSLLIPVEVGGQVGRLEIREGEWRHEHYLYRDQVAFYEPFLEGPLSLTPHSTIRGKLGFIGHSTLSGDDPDPLPDAKLRIVEHFSGESVETRLHNGRFP